MDYFEIGDKVRVVKLDWNWSEWAPELSNYIGKTGVIVVNCRDHVGIEFDDETGRWYFCKNWLELVEKAEKYWTGKVVCVDTESEEYFVVGKAYMVKDGKIFGENHCEIQTCYTEPITKLNLGDISWCPLLPNVFSTKFIEYKGMAGE